MGSAARPGDAVLDVGCNSGYIVDFLPPSCIAYGVDVSPELVARARKRMNDVRVAPAEALPFLSKCFDVVLLGEIIEHVHDPAVVLREAMRVSRRVVVGSTPHEAGKWGPRGPRKPATHRFHVRCFTEETLRALLVECGLVNVKIATVVADRVPQMYLFSGNVGQ